MTITIRNHAATADSVDGGPREQPVEAQAFNNGVAEAEEGLRRLTSLFSPDSAPGDPQRTAGSGAADGGPAAETRQGSLIEQMSAIDFLAFLDQGAGATYISPQLETLLGYSPREWLNDPAGLYQRIHPEDRERLRAEGAELFQTDKPLRSIYRVLAHDGRVVWLHCEARMVRRLEGRPWFIHGVAFDVTGLKDAEAELRREYNELEARASERAAQLMEANASLQREIAIHERIERDLADVLARERKERAAAETAGALMDEFLESASHELRSPLTSILGWTEMLRSGTLDAAGDSRALLNIENSVKAQARLVNDLLDVSHIAGGKLLLNSIPIDLINVVEAAVDAARPAVEAKQLRLKMALEPWVSPFIGDPDRLKQIVWNLLSNAIKFTPAGGAVEVRLERLGDKALITVSDNGRGVSPELLPYVFDRFGGPTEQTRGGLGLAIVKQLVELHGGAVNVFSQGKDKGAEFTIILPLAIPRPEQQLAGARAAAGIQPHPDPLAGRRLLLVDDEMDARDVLSAILRQSGAEVRATASAAEAVGLLRWWLPDLLISDIGMPEEDGYTLLRYVRSLPPDQGGLIPAIALTAHAGDRDRQLAVDAGYQAHLAKPAEPSALVALAASLIKQPLPGAIAE